MSEKDPDRGIIARYKPWYWELKKDRAYGWCSCGRSANQPFCDGSHKGSDFQPVRYVAQQEGEEVLFCGCKQTCSPPFCDGAHNNLRDTCQEDDPCSAENLAVQKISPAPDGKALLDGGCFVWSKTPSDFSPDNNGVLTCSPIFTAEDGAQYQSYFHLEVVPGVSPAVHFPDRQVVLFIASGEGTINISGRDFQISPEQGVLVFPGEAFQFLNQGPEPIRLTAAVSPIAEDPELLTEMPDDFDATQPERVVAIDSSVRNRMGDRFFQMLIDKRIGSRILTQFAGVIPFGKTAPHRHLYEESLLIIKGTGCMWTETRKAPVKEGEIIFLPRKQLHSLECTDADGLMVVGVIYPGDNPTINY